MEQTEQTGHITDDLKVRSAQQLERARAQARKLLSLLGVETEQGATDQTSTPFFSFVLSETTSQSYLLHAAFMDELSIQTGETFTEPELPESLRQIDEIIFKTTIGGLLRELIVSNRVEGTSSISCLGTIPDDAVVLMYSTRMNPA